MALTTVKSDQIQTSVALAGSPTTTTQSASDNSTKVATTAYVETAVANLVASAPAALNTLDELAAALNDDASFSTTITNSIATKLPLAGGTLTGNLAVVFDSNNSGNRLRIADTEGASAGIRSYSTSDGTGLILNHYYAVAGSPYIRYADFVASQGDAAATTMRFLTKPHNSNPTVALTLDNSQNATIAGGLAVDTTTFNVDNANNRVGIGTASPSRLLTVNSTGQADLTIRSGNSDYSQLMFGDQAADNRGGILYNNNTDDLHIATTITSGAGIALTVDSSQKVGIGTTSPGRLLTLFNNDQPVFQITNNTSGTASTRGLIQYMANGTTTAVFDNQGSGSGGQFTFMQAGATRMAITPAGLVGIGRVPAFAQLEVQGDKTLANSLQLQLNGATDSNKQMIMGFDTTANKSYIISQIAGSARKELQMNVETLIVDNNLNDKIARFVTTGAQGITVGTSATDSAGRAVHIAHDGTGSAYIHPYNYAGSSFDAIEIRASNTAIKKTDGSTALNVDASGVVTQEYLPAFNAYYNGNGYGINNNTVWAHNATRYNNGGHFNTSNYRFTAPKAGFYWFYFRTIMYGNGNNGHISFTKNGSAIGGTHGHYSKDTGNYWQVFSIATVIDLAANDYVQVYNHTRSVSQYHGNDWNEFSGYLVG